MQTIISNDFTGYRATIQTKALPSVSTIKRHLSKAKASDCKSITIITVDGVRYYLYNHGCGLELHLGIA